MINSRTTPFDTFTEIAIQTLKVALNDGSDRDILESYISKFCEFFINYMWQCVFNTIAVSELYSPVRHRVSRLIFQYQAGAATTRNFPQYG